MKFNSQICTTKEQSERLLALGLKKETADMFYSHDKDEDIYAIRACWGDFWDSNKLIDGHIRRHCIPAWSLHRLIEIYESVGDISPWSLDFVNYNRLIQLIGLAIKHGVLNKEYLEE